MERYQFINSLAKKAGVNESETRLFAEIFLRKVYELLQPGDAVKVNGIGTAYFARTKFNLNNIAEQKDDFTEVIIFSDLLLNGNGESKSVIFTLPAAEEIKHSALDKFFSLSPSKPVVQNSNYFQGDIIIPPTGNELEVLLGSKTEKLLADHQVIKNYVEPGLIVNPLENSKVETKNSFDETFLDDELDSLLLSDIKDEELLKELENISWEMDDETSEEPIENKSEQVEKDESDNLIEITTPKVLDRILPLKDTEEQEQLNESDEQNVNDNFTNEIISKSKISFEQIINKKEDSDKSEFERVKSFSAEFSDVNPESESIEEGDAFQAAIDKVTRELESGDNNNENIFGGIDSTEKNGDEFIEVIPKSSVFNSNIINVIEEETKTEDDVQPESSKIDPEEYHRNALKEATKFVNERRSMDEIKGKKRRVVSLIIIIVILLLLAASIYIYLKHIKTPESALNGVNGGGNTATISLVEVIERNYELPVTYPYPAANRNQFIHYEGIDSSVFAISDVLNSNNPENTLTQTDIRENSTVSVPVDVAGKLTPVRIKNNIYKYGDSFILQVASFKSKSIAESEGLKYTKLGHQTYIEEVEIPERGTWFRLRIGNFATLAEVENFSSKMK